MRPQHLLIGFLIPLLLLAGAVIWHIRLPVQADPRRWEEHAGPIIERMGKGAGLKDLCLLRAEEGAKNEDGGADVWRITMPGFSERRLRLPVALDLRPFKSLRMPLELKTDHLGSVLVSLRLVHHNGWIYETWRERVIDCGEKGLLRVDLRPQSSDFSPIGHARPWDAESARAIVQVNLRLRSPSAFSGALRVGLPELDGLGEPDETPSTVTSGPATKGSDPDGLKRTGTAKGLRKEPPLQDAGHVHRQAWPPQDLEVVDAEVSLKGDRLEVSMRLTPSPPDPFDPEQCDLRVLVIDGARPVEGVFDAGSGGSDGLKQAKSFSDLLARARPAFHDQRFLKAAGFHKPAEELRPVGLPIFRARIQWPSAQDDGPTRLKRKGVLIFLNGRVLGHLPLRAVSFASVLSESEKVHGPVAAAEKGQGDLMLPPAWMEHGGESFSRLYRPRPTWTGMPWKNEVARYESEMLATSEGAPADVARAESNEVNRPSGNEAGRDGVLREQTENAAGAGDAREGAWVFEPFTDPVLCWDPPLEWNAAWGKWQGVGRYDLELCWRFDRILERAEMDGVRLPLLLTRDGMFFNQGKFRWPMNPMAASAGGPVEGPGSFYSAAPARAIFKRRIRYLAARYGTSAALGDWLFGACLPAKGVAEWHGEMAAYIAALNRATGWLEEGLSSEAEAQPAYARRNVLSLHPWATPFEALTRRNSFEEEGMDHVYWKAEQRLSPGSVKKLKTDRASDGTRSIELSGSFPGQVCLMRELLFARNEADNFYKYKQLLFDLYVPEGAPHDMRAVIHLRDRDELWYEALLDPLLRPGDWTRLVVDVTAANAHGLKPVNHSRPWDDYSRTRVREIGIRIFCGHPYDGGVRIDNIHFVGEQTGRVDKKVVPKIQLRGPPAPRVARFDKWELDFDLNKSYSNPYDPEVVEVNAQITTPSGKLRVVPAFFYEPYERRLVKKTVHDEVFLQKHERETNVEEIVPVRGGMAGFWKLRFAPDEEGPHRVVLEVREGGAWTAAREAWIPDNRFTQDGKPLPGGRYHGDFTRIYGLQDDGRRRQQWIDFTSGPVVARSDAIAFEASEGNAKGFVRRSKDPRYLEHADGSFFYPMGMNLATPSEQQIPYRGDEWDYFRLSDIGHRGTFQYDDYFAAFRKHGLNWAKLWMATWWTALEWRRDWPPYQGVGRYSQPNAWRMDYLVEEARKHEIYLQVILMNHGQVSSGINHDWENSPYNDALGGPLLSAREFFSEAEGKKLFKNKLRYIAARWGYSTSILDWTLCGEMDFTEEYQTNSFDLYVPSKDKPAPKVMVMWVEEMGDYMHSIDPGRHLLSVHLSHPQRGQNIQFAKALDIAQSNAYSGFPWLADGKMNAVDAIEAYYYGQQGTHFFEGMKQFDKPVLICEQGGHWHGISWKYGNWTRNTRASLDADLHCGLWAGILSPMAGQTGYWWWIHVHFDDTYAHFMGASRFMAGEDLRGKNYTRERMRVKNGGGHVEGLAFHNGHEGFAWIYDSRLPMDLTPKPRGGVRSALTVDEGRYEIEYWHTVKGEIIGRQEASSMARTPDSKEHCLVFDLPDFDGDIAVKYRVKK